MRVGFAGGRWVDVKDLDRNGKINDCEWTEGRRRICSTTCYFVFFCRKVTFCRFKQARDRIGRQNIR